MSAMAVSSALGALWKNVFTRHLMHRKRYEQVEVESRSGFALSETELKQLDDVVSPLLKKGQSLHHISVHHADELMKYLKEPYIPI